MRRINYLLHPVQLFSKIVQRVFLRISAKKRIEDIWKRTMDYQLDLDNPKTFNEKIQWIKLYHRNPMYTRLADKYLVKEWVRDTIGEQYVIPNYGVYRSFDEINFNELPNQFVLKCNHDCGSVIVCTDKSKFDKDKARSILEKGLGRDFSKLYEEWGYKNIPRRIIAEKYMKEGDGIGITDYKFFCFNGEPKFLYVSYGLSDWRTASINYLNIDWTPAPFHRPDFSEFSTLPPKPDKFDDMVRVSRILSKDFSMVRVDLYQIDGQVYVSEMTFTPGAGFDKFEPQEWDRKIGDMFSLPPKIV